MPGTLVKETITINKPVQGKFGPQVLVGEKSYYSFGRGYNGSALEAGHTYEVEVEVTAKGYKYINSATEMTQPESAKQDKPVKENTKKASRTPAQAATSAESDKNARILAQGVWQAVASNPGLLGLASNVDALKAVIRELALDGMKFVQENS